MNDDVVGGRYRLDALIAEGGMAKVYKGTDQRLGRTVAIKVLAAHLASDTQFVARFEAEAKAAASLDHPNVVRVFDTGADGGRHYLVMQYVQGPTLAELLARDGPFDPASAVEVAAQVGEALAAAHRLGIVHRDVKPGNIMLEDGRTVKVMDFGIAKTAMGGLTQVGDVLGTAAYLSPEQARGGAVDLRSDIYSLGCVLYEMLTGRPPLPGDTLLEVANRLATERPQPPSELNPTVHEDLDEVVMRALEKDPERRFESASQMLRALEDAGRGGLRIFESRGRGPSTLVLERPARNRPARRRWGPVAGLGLLGLLALIAGARMLLPASSDSGVQPSPSATPSEVVTETAPATDPPVQPEPDSGVEAVSQAVDALRSSIGSAIGAGQLSSDAGEEILEEVSDARLEYADRDYGEAVESIGKAREELDKYREDGEVAPSAYSLVEDHLARLQRLVSL